MSKQEDIVNNLEDFDDLPLIEGDIGADPNTLGESAAANK